jgi:glycogen(starch) synthase
MTSVLMSTDVVGGVWTYALELAAALAARDVDVHLATLGAPLRADQRAQLRASPVASVHASDWRLEWMERPWADVDAAGRWLLDVRDRVQPDLVHLNHYAHGALTWEAPLVVVAHSDVLSWFRAVRGEDAPPEWNRYARVVADGLAAAGVVVAPTHALLDEIEELYAPPGELRVIPNGRTPGAARADKEPFVLCAGRLWDDAKNAAALDRIAPSLSWPVLLAGDATRRPRHARHVGLVGAGALAALMARASIYALPARYEPFGLSALEAAQAGCALVLGDIPSLREVWDDAALYVDPDDDDAISAAIAAVIADDDLRRALGARARERSARYTPSRMADAYLDAYACVRAAAGAAA